MKRKRSKTGQRLPGARNLLQLLAHFLAPPKTATKSREGTGLMFAPRYDTKMDEFKNELRLDTYNQDYPLNLRVKVPKQSNLTVKTYYDGYLQVRGVEGNIRARSQNCEIRLLDVSGTASASTYNGDITVRMVGVKNDADLDFESYNGSIEVSLPESVNATTAVSAGMGAYQTDFRIEPAVEGATTKFNSSNFENKDSYQFGSINSGGVPLRIESEKGKISLRKIAP